MQCFGFYDRLSRDVTSATLCEEAALEVIHTKSMQRGLASVFFVPLTEKTKDANYLSDKRDADVKRIQRIYFYHGDYI